MYKVNRNTILITVWTVLLLTVAAMDSKASVDTSPIVHGSEVYTFSDKERIIIQYINDDAILTYWKDHKPSFYRMHLPLSGDGIIVWKNIKNEDTINHQYINKTYFRINIGDTSTIYPYYTDS